MADPVRLTEPQRRAVERMAARDAWVPIHDLHWRPLDWLKAKGLATYRLGFGRLTPAGRELAAKMKGEG